MWLDDQPMASRQEAASCLKEARRQLKMNQKERVRVYKAFVLQNFCCLSQLAATYLVHGLFFLPLGGNHEGVCQVWKRSAVTTG